MQGVHEAESGVCLEQGHHGAGDTRTVAPVQHIRQRQQPLRGVRRTMIQRATQIALEGRHGRLFQRHEVLPGLRRAVCPWSAPGDSALRQGPLWFHPDRRYGYKTCQHIWLFLLLKTGATSRWIRTRQIRPV